jgi:spore germination protein GerM
MRARHPGRVVLGSLVSLAFAAAAGCGVPADDKPRAISEENLPDDAEGRVDAAEDGQTESADLYFTRSDGERSHLVALSRQVPISGPSSDPSPATALEALLEGVSPDDDADITTVIPPGTSLASQPMLEGDAVLVVDLTPGINNVRGDAARLAFGQIVCTADALAEVDAVRFEVEGQPLTVPKGDGEASGAAVTCRSYENLL